MKNPELFAQNVERLARDNPLEAYRLEKYGDSLLKFCTTLDDELNLVNERNVPPHYLHDQGGAIWAAQRWAEQISLEGVDVFFVYGLGLGYYYLSLKDWLKDPSHYLVFLEDDKGVVYNFLQTDLAAEILENSQVIVKILPVIEPDEEGWAKLRVDCAWLFWAFARSTPQISALQSYYYAKNEFFRAFSLEWLAELSRACERLKEFYFPYSSDLFRNFYANMPHLGETIPGYELKNALDSIPAVLCGAGPSLTKQIPLLKTLSDRAFLIGSGSGMNALTQASIVPHVGGAVDPTPTQASRQLTSFGFDVPAFYQNRFYWQALSQWHGPLLYMTGSGSYRVSEWFEIELGIHAEQIIMGVSTSNFLLEIARFLGCNPIILVGMDLAYTKDKRYSEGVLAHPTDAPKEHKAIDKKEERLLAVQGVEGKDVFTTSQWFYEAVYMGAFKHRNSETTLINATEGGMAIPCVDNEAFAETIKEHLTHSWDVEGMFHGAIQNASAHKIPSERLFEVLATWGESLEACIKCLKVLSKQPEKAFLEYEELHQEAAYIYLLKMLGTVFDTLNSLRMRKLKWKSDPVEKKTLENERLAFLLMYAEDHLKSLREGIQAFEERKIVLAKKVLKQERPVVSPQEYSQPDDAMCESKMYPDGKIKIEAFYQLGKLHGPWSFFSPVGTLLYRSWFVGGKKQGKAFAYYLDGNLYGITNYCDGVAEGEQLHYYPDGTLKTVTNYKKGLLNGKVQLYYVNGQLKKEQHFVDGRLHGLERMWDEKGKLTLETEW